MGDEDKTIEQLISEMEELHQLLPQTELLKSECIQAEEALWKIHKKCIVNVEALADTLYQLNPEGKFVYVNEDTIYIFGYSMHEILKDMGVNKIMDLRDVIVLPCRPKIWFSCN